MQENLAPATNKDMVISVFLIILQCDPDDDGDGIADPDKGDLCFQLARTKGNPDSYNPKTHNSKGYDPKAHNLKGYYSASCKGEYEAVILFNAELTKHNV